MEVVEVDVRELRGRMISAAMTSNTTAIRTVSGIDWCGKEYRVCLICSSGIVRQLLSWTRPRSEPYPISTIPCWTFAFWIIAISFCCRQFPTGLLFFRTSLNTQYLYRSGSCFVHYSPEFKCYPRNDSDVMKFTPFFERLVECLQIFCNSVTNMSVMLIC